MKKHYLLFFLLLTSLSNWAQVNYVQDYETSAGRWPWLQLQGINPFIVGTDAPCSGLRSLSTGLIGKKESGIAILMSNNLGNSNEGLVDFSFDYKWIKTDDDFKTAAPKEELTFKWQWANAVGGPWNTFLQVDANKHIESTSCQQLSAKFVPAAGAVYVRIIIENLTNTSANTFFIDNLSIKQSATPVTCKPVRNLKITDNTSLGFKASWVNGNTSIESYEYEIRTSGLPGSGDVGLDKRGQIIGSVTSYDFDNLSPNTDYKIYIKAKCSTEDDSVWVFIPTRTLCKKPEIIVEEIKNLCGPQSVQMTAYSPTSDAKYWWFDAKGKEVGNSDTYTTSELFDSTNYTILVGNYKILENLRVAQNTFETIQNTEPLRGTTSKTQYIYTADELRSSGAKPGLIKAIGFIQKGSFGTAKRNNFSLYLGKVDYEVFPGAKTSSVFEPNANLTLVKEAASFEFKKEDLNLIELDRFFEWDGLSNLVLEVIYVETQSGTTGSISVEATMPYVTGNQYDDGVNPPYWRTIRATTTKNKLADYADVKTGTGVGYRPNIFLDVLEGCGSSKEVKVNVNTPPPLKLETNHIQSCTANGLPTIAVVDGADNYDNYEWIPNENVTGDEIYGWVFDITKTKEYTLKATKGNCVNIQKVLVEVNDSPKIFDLPKEYNLCYDNAQELIATDLVNDKAVVYDFDNDITKATLKGAGPGDEIIHEKLLSANGSTGSLRFAYGPQTMANVSFPPYDLKNIESVVVEFDHIAALQAISGKVSDFGYLEYSTNNGATWKRFEKSSYTGNASKTLPVPTIDGTFTQMYFTQTSYPEWQGLKEGDIPTNAMWKHEKFTVPASDFNGAGSFIVRFKIGSDATSQYKGWFIDNVKIQPINRDRVIWEPIDHLYLDKQATMPYDGTVNVGKVYLLAKDTNVTNLKYKVTIEKEYKDIKSYMCSVSREFNVSVGLYELPTVKDLTNCGTLNVADTGFVKNENGELKYYVSNNEPNAITQIVKSGIYYVEQIISGCRTKRVPFTVVINEKATEPILNNNQIFCGAAIVSDIVFEEVPGLQMKWFKTAEGGVELDKATSLETGVYYAEFNNGVCKSQRVAVNITIGTRPQPLVTQDVSTCGTTTISDVVIPSIAGAKVNWYKNDTDTKALATTTVLNSGVYYVAQQLDGCESVRKAINVITIQNLTAPQSVAQTFCGSALVSDLVADGLSGAVLNWYNSPTSPSSLAPGAKLASGTYYVSQTVGTCVSPRKAINVKILSINAPVIAPIYVCGTANVTSLGLQTTGQTYYRVYALKQGGVEMGQNDVIKTGTYYISKVESGCESQRATVQVTVTPRPNAPTGNTKQSFNDYAEVSNLKMNEAVIWFDSYNDAVNNANPLPAKTALQNNKTYYAVVEGPNGCTSLPTAVTVTIVLGLNDLDLASLKYYPNPADSELTVSYKEPIRSIEIYDILGKQIKVQKFKTNEVRLDVSRLSSGTYMLKVQTDSGSQFVKIVKK